MYGLLIDCCLYIWYPPFRKHLSPYIYSYPITSVFAFEKVNQLLQKVPPPTAIQKHHPPFLQAVLSHAALPTCKAFWDGFMCEHVKNIHSTLNCLILVQSKCRKFTPYRYLHVIFPFRHVNFFTDWWNHPIFINSWSYMVHHTVLYHVKMIAINVQYYPKNVFSSFIKQYSQFGKQNWSHFDYYILVLILH